MHQWSDSEIRQLSPKADSKTVFVSSDDDDYFCFDAYGVSREEFNAYVEDVKINGFTVDGYDSSNYYYAENIDGIEADIDYSVVEESMTGCVEPE